MCKNKWMTLREQLGTRDPMAWFNLCNLFPVLLSKSAINEETLRSKNLWNMELSIEQKRIKKELIKEKVPKEEKKKRIKKHTFQ